jgi:curved DNA-binding protein CbpA
MQHTLTSRIGRLLVGRLQAAASPVSLSLTIQTTASSFFFTDTAWRGVPALYTSTRFASSSATAAARPGQRNHYRSLGVDADATPQEVKAAYRQLALRYHPDVAAAEHRAQAEMLFRRVSEAYEVLSDPVKRRAHDSELGIPTRRKQSTAGAAAGATAPPSARAHGAATSGSGSVNAAHGKRKTARTCASASDTSSPSSYQQQQHQKQQHSRRYRKPFVRGDANRVFADAFDGKSLDEILFDVQRRRRQAAATKHNADAMSSVDTKSPLSSPGSSSASPLPEAALDRDARLRHVLEEAAESFAHKAQRQYGHGILRHIRAASSSLPEGPAPPPGAYMPFRPFVGMEMPTGVQTPPEPQLGHVLTPQEATMEDGEGEAGESSNLSPAKKERVTPQFHTHRYADGLLHSRMESLRKATKNVEGMPHNMGQLYSYHRPY